MHWPSALQPLIIPQSHPERSKLLDLVLTLQKESERLKSRLPTSLADALPRLIRSMNCYYSNLMEGHNTHPVDIERALQQDYSQDQEKRALQREAVAHIEVQSWLDAQLFDRQALFSVALAKEIHSRFIQLLPEALRWVETPDSGERIEVLPGQLRRNDVRIGQHVAPPVQEVPELLARWEKAYAPLSVVEQLLHVAAAHHRWLWIHPFNDGNGRVARLLSHVQFNKLLEAGALWSISRGLARNVDQYKQLLAACDQPRRNDLDGRGHLSQKALIQFTAFILETCALDQVRFMHDLIQPQALNTRILRWTVEQIEARHLPKGADTLMAHLLIHGQMTRSQAQQLLNVSDRQARRVVSALEKTGAVHIAHKQAPIELNLSERLAGAWFPKLFPVV